ncbi:diaminopimelate epimerase [Spiractinospora alimapuensis]|uniref:diaminopimelate epimerase n=1 Tax=Spiractinospora alimapuensis TaxID=2820884 RepID=UPI001EEC6968|nr:diaminopimelate epimerase [Spiractinospora alimapuensis]QVQ53625.1 diaminopimelate epimerase [Spiractinospora alimapuensis]
MRFAKGHGTENDFVVLPDPSGELDLPESRVVALCDRRAGLGADGVLRVVRTEAIAGNSDVPASAAEWFMDYRNADGSVAEMCGNGVRVFARYLLEEGLVRSSAFVVGTRAGDRAVEIRDDGTVRVAMGTARTLGSGTATLAGEPVVGERVWVGNPHLACATSAPVERLDLTQAPTLDAEQFPDGANVEFFRVLEPGLLEMRVFERGSGETRSCGTGIVASAVTAAAGEPGRWRVRVPGGECQVDVDTEAGTHLTGPAVIVASGDVRL